MFILLQDYIIRYFWKIIWKYDFSLFLSFDGNVYSYFSIQYNYHRLSYINVFAHAVIFLSSHYVHNFILEVNGTIEFISILGLKDEEQLVRELFLF